MKKRTKAQTHRLENLAKILEEATPKRDQFYMGSYVHFCGTPSCALGFYASREDLQRLLKIVVFSSPGTETFSQIEYRGEDGAIADYCDEKILDHFGLDMGQVFGLFSSGGMGGANTAKQAAKYVRRFLKTQPNLSDDC